MTETGRRLIEVIAEYLDESYSWMVATRRYSSQQTLFSRVAQFNSHQLLARCWDCWRRVTSFGYAIASLILLPRHDRG